MKVYLQKWLFWAELYTSNPDAWYGLISKDIVIASDWLNRLSSIMYPLPSKDGGIGFVITTKDL